MMNLVSLLCEICKDRFTAGSDQRRCCEMCGRKFAPCCFGSRPRVRIASDFFERDICSECAR